MKKHSLHVGLNFTSYKINNDTLSANSPYINTLYYNELAKNNNFEPKLLLNEEATSKNVINELKNISEQVTIGDLVFFTFCGHGDQIYSDDEPDFRDEILFLYDRVFLDDEFKACWSNFAEGVRIFIVTNSCNNETLIDFDYEIHSTLVLKENDIQICSIPLEITPKEYITPTQYFNYLQSIKSYTKPMQYPKNPIIHISSSKDNNTSPDSRSLCEFSEFTKAFKKITDEKFKGTYMEFFDELKKIVTTNPSIEINKNCSETEINNFLNKPFLNNLNN